MDSTFSREKIKDDYIGKCKQRSCNAKKNMDDIFLFKKILSFFIRLIQSGISQSNCCLLILDGHGSSHVTLKTIKSAHQIGLNMITRLHILPSYHKWHHIPLCIPPIVEWKYQIHWSGLGLCPNGHC